MTAINGQAPAVEMHCHSLFSPDGRATPEEVVDLQADAGVVGMALTDHDSIGGLARARQRAAERGLRFMDGAELDACWEGCGYHFLAFGMDPADARLRELCQELERQFETDFERILPRLTERYGLTREAFADKLGAYYRTHPAPRLNRFFAQELLLERGVFPDAAAMRNEIDALSNQAPALPGPAPAAVSVERVRDIVHAAGGILLVAHPTKYGRRGQWDRQRELIHAMLDLGLDGFELYHPAAVAEPHFAELEAEARRLKCAVSGGSDGHCDPHPRSPLPPGFRCPAWVMETVEAALAARRGCSAARCRCPSDSDSRAEVPS